MSKLMHVKHTRAKGRDYYYFDTGQKDDAGKAIWKRLPDPRDRTFGAVYAAMLGHRERRASPAVLLTVAGLVELYQASPHFNKLEDGTRKNYAIYNRQLIAQLGAHAPAHDLQRSDVVMLLDRMADRTGAANALLKSSRALYAWGRKRGHVAHDPFADVEAFVSGEYEPWPVPLVEAALASQNDTVRLAVHLLYYTAQRIGDACKMQWRDIADGRIHVVQQKTRKPLSIPLHDGLIAELATREKTLATIIPGKPGKSKTEAIRNAIKAWALEQGHTVVPHGLRKNAVIALLQKECSVAETAAISGQSLSVVEYYAKRRNQSTLADSAMTKWQTKGD